MSNESENPRARLGGRVLLAFGVVVAMAVGSCVVHARHVPTWGASVVRYYDASGAEGTVEVAAERWNAAGADVELRRVDSPRDADVIVRVDDGRLRHLCGRDCLGYSTSIGRPKSGHGEVLLLRRLAGHPRPLSVWVAAHEFGHVLGLRHRDGHACSVMSARAFDTRCAPSLNPEIPTADQLACVPAPADVDAAAKLYGGKASSRDPDCL